MQKKIKQERGSVTVLVLSSIFIILLILVSIYIASTSKNRTEDEAIRKIQAAYDMSEEEMQELYTKITNGQNERVNPPEMLTGMKKIMFTEPTDTKKGGIVQEGEADFAENGWYSYEDKKWANARTEDGSMWVWIPRFAYKIKYNNPSDKSAGGTIDVKFLIGTTDNYYDEESKEIKKAQRQKTKEETIDTTADYTVHPAFTNETSIDFANGGWDKELTGIWVAKFEAGYATSNGNEVKVKESSVNYTQNTVYAPLIENNDDINGKDGKEIPARNWLDGTYGETETKIKYPVFQGSSYSMNYINHNDCFNISKALTESGNIYGLSNNSTDSHLMKNSEWGMVAILSKSKYGKNDTEVTINSKDMNNGGNENKGKTKEDGNSLASVYAVTGYNNGNKEWNDYVAENASPSSTGNIYGIYDLSGGVWERTATYVATTNVNLKKHGKSIAFDGETLREKSTKYTMVYPKGETSTTLDNASTENYEANTKIYGDMVRETSKAGLGSTSWNSDTSKFVGWSFPFSLRGRWL